MKSSIIEYLSVKQNQITREYTTPNPPHGHSQWELVLFEKGVCINGVNEKQFTATRGDIFLLGPPHIHEIQFKTQEHLHRDVYFSVEEMKNICANFSPTLYDELSDNKQLLTLTLSPSVYETIDMLMQNLDALILATYTDSNISHNSLRGIAHAILNLVLSIFYSQSALKKISIPLPLLTVLNNLKSPEYFTQKVNDIIADINYSHSQFLKIFKQHTGVSLVQYLQHLRINYAAELLRNTNDTVLSVCEKSGYDSLSFFIKSFKSTYGLTPLQYRKKSTPPRQTR